MVSPLCGGYSFNSDPLNFYCQDQWWLDPNREGLDPEPMGNKMTIPLNQEVPVGKTVDDTEKWVSALIERIKKMNDSIETILDQMAKAGNAYKDNVVKDYCKCNAKFEDNSPVCKTDCQYSQYNVQIPVYSQDPSTGEAIQVGTTMQLQCSCGFLPCNGNPCQQILDYLSEIWNNYRQFKLDFIDFYTYMLAEPRSDILKELTYSRNMANTCSALTNTYDSRLLSCTRVQEELIDPVNNNSIKFDNKNFLGYCYGRELGKILNTSLTDNWFCAEIQKNEGDLP
jgi:hypothetical protein